MNEFRISVSIEIDVMFGPLTVSDISGFYITRVYGQLLIESGFSVGTALVHMAPLSGLTPMKIVLHGPMPVGESIATRW